MTRAIEPLGAGRQKVLIIMATIMLLSSSGAWGSNVTQSVNASYSGNLVLNVYINDAGRALVTGYAESIDGLSFLKSSQYQYDEDTKQLYVLTNSLTYKSGDDWEARMLSQGEYGEYHSIFYMPSSVTISMINSTPGLEYLVSASNESFVVDLHGYDITDPDITINYKLPLGGGTAPPGDQGNDRLIPAIALLGFAFISASVMVWMRRGRRSKARPHAGAAEPADLAAGSPDGGSKGGPAAELDARDDGPGMEGDQTGPGQSPDPGLEVLSEPDAAPDRGPLDDGAPEDQDRDRIYCPGEIGDGAAGEGMTLPAAGPGAGHQAQGASRIEVTSEMAAVMETLTTRERAVLTALIGKGGRMTQADIRYETRIPKSSLTGIILSLERRKLVIKKEWGRTNIIELSEWFLSRGERS